MTPWQWPLKVVAKTRACRFRVWLWTMPLHPLPGGGRVEMRLHLKQWDHNAAEPYSWCLQETKYAEKGNGSMDPYKPFQLKQISQRDWPVYLATLAIEIRAVLEVELVRFMAMAPPVQGTINTEEVA